MSDEQHWKPPVFTGGPGTPDGAFVPPGPATPAAAHAYGPPLQAPPPEPPAGSWTAPPKPGLIPLRPLTLGAILGAAFQILRRNPRPTFGFAFVIQTAIMLLTTVFSGLVMVSAFTRLATSSESDTAEIGAGAFATILLSALIPAVISMVALALVQGILMLEIQRATLGEKLKLKQLWRRARGRLGALIGWMLLLTAASLVGVAVLALLLVLLTMLGEVGVVAAVVVGIFGWLAFVVAIAWLGTKLSLVPSVLMGERTSIRKAVRRSWWLTDGFFWRTFGIQLLVAVILGLAVQVVTVPIQLLAPLTVFLVDPNGTAGPVAIVVMAAVSLVSALVVLVMTSIALVVQSATTGLIYIDLRMRKEGLDLELARYVEQAGAGQVPPDPYLGEPAADGKRQAAASQPMPSQSDSPWT